MKDQDLAIVSQNSNTDVRPPYVVSTIIQSRSPAEVGVEQHKIELFVMNEMQVLLQLFVEPKLTLTDASNALEEGNGNPAALSPQVLASSNNIIFEEEKKEEPEEIPHTYFYPEKKHGFPALAFNPQLNTELEIFHQSLLSDALRGDPSLSINNLLEIFFETEEEKLLESQIQRYEFQLLALKVRQTLIDTLLHDINRQQFNAMTPEQAQQRLEQAKQSLAKDQEHFQFDYLYDEHGKRRLLSDEVHRLLLGFSGEYINYCIAQLIALFQEKKQADSLESFYTELQTQQVCCNTLIEERLQLSLKLNDELELLQNEREQRYHTQVFILYKALSKREDASCDLSSEKMRSESENSFSDGIFENIDAPVEFIPVPKLPELPSIYQGIFQAKTFKNLCKSLLQQQNLWPGLNTHYWSDFISKLTLLTPRNCLLPEQKEFYLEVASRLPESLYLLLPARVLNQSSRLRWFHPTDPLKHGQLYIHVTERSVIFKALREGGDETSTVRCELSAEEFDTQLGAGMFNLFKEKVKEQATSWWHYLDEEQHFSWLNDSLIEKLFELVMQRCELVNDFTDLDELLKVPASGLAPTLQALYSTRLWIANDVKKLELLKKVLFFCYLKRYLLTLDINKAYKDKTLLQRLCDQEPLDYYLMVHLLLLGADANNLPQDILRSTLALMSWVEAVENFRQTKIAHMLAYSSQDPDLSELSQRWKELRNSTIDNPQWEALRKNAANMPKKKNNSTPLHHLFPEDCLRAAAALSALLVLTRKEEAEKNKKAKDEQQLPAFYKQMQYIYDRLIEAAQQSKWIKANDDLLFSDDLKATIENTANQWWDKMPRPYLKWFENLHKPYQKAWDTLKVSKVLSLKSHRSKSGSKNGQAVPYSIRSDSKEFLEVVNEIYDRIECGRNDPMTVLAAHRQKIIMQEQQIVGLRQENSELNGRIKTLENGKGVLEGEVSTLQTQLSNVTTELDSTKTQFNNMAVELNNTNAKLNSMTTEFQEMKDQLASLRSNQWHSNHPPLNSSENETPQERRPSSPQFFKNG